MFRFKNSKVIYSSTLFSYYFIKENDKNKKTFTYDEIEKHKTKETKIYTTYKQFVYDITDFIDIHPGGKDYIMKCAGTSVEPYWDKYRVHYNDNVLKTILYPMKIGTIKDYDKNKYAPKSQLYINEPHRHNLYNLNYHSLHPCNAECDTKNLRNNWITPIENWYIRNHAHVPNIDKNNYKLHIDISQNKTNGFFSYSNYDLKYNYLKSLKKQDLFVTLQCGGNRRGELNIIDKTLGTPWNNGAISNGKFTGIFLRDILPKNISDNIKYVNVKGYDDVEISLPIEKILDNNGDVLLAYKMNNQELLPDHGFPLRLIVPGYVGIRNIKWVKSIKLSETPVNSAWHSSISYKCLPNYIKNKEQLKNINLDLDNYNSMYCLPVQSFICDVVEEEEYYIIKGIAYSGGGRGILRVDVSIDDGYTWDIAELKEGNEQNVLKSWAWTFWEYKVDKSEVQENLLLNDFYNDYLPLFKKNKLKIMCKATDIDNNVQNKSLEDAWNLRGLNNNSYHKYIYEY